uniref:GB1/RHD3-type G domain-containing protein n=1 Tax=Marmota marmota marmota TaxID=9994 RepID=A0A8C6ACF5_MARMA
MTSGPIMLVPVCLVEKNNEQLRVNQKALKILRKISQPVVVVAIVGPYRTGKSYLMNHLAFLWDPQCNLKPRASGCGVCPTPTSQTTVWFFWTLRAWEMCKR